MSFRHLDKARAHIEELAAISRHSAMEAYEGRLLHALIEDLRECYSPIAKRMVRTSVLIDLTAEYGKAMDDYFNRLVLSKK